MQFVMFAGGLIALIAGSSLLVKGASRLALSFGISPLVVGLTVVAFGTSAPEMAISVGAVLGGRVDLAIGNVVGSNIFNVLFILGLSALIAPLVVNIQVIRQEVPIMIGSALLLLFLGLDGRISWQDAALLLALLMAYTGFLIVQSRRETQAVQNEYSESFGPATRNDRKLSLLLQIVFILAGLGGLVLGSQWLVDSAVMFAKAMGISDLIIGLTIVAAGTSLPEVATSIMAAFKGERDIAVGNVVGSNIFNILGCLGLSGLAAGAEGLTMTASLLAFDIWVMLAVILACIPIFLTGREIARWEGAIFLLYYAAYVYYLILAAQQHAALRTYTLAMAGFVLPLTIFTLVAVLIKQRSNPA